MNRDNLIYGYFIEYICDRLMKGSFYEKIPNAAPLKDEDQAVFLFEHNSEIWKEVDEIASKYGERDLGSLTDSEKRDIANEVGKRADGMLTRLKINLP